MGGHRLGDIIDDYCSRCRLLTNHSIAALVGEEVKKVICRTCQHSHDYRHGKGGQKKKQKQSAYEQVLASVLAGKSVESVARPAEAAQPSRVPARPRAGSHASRGNPFRAR